MRFRRPQSVPRVALLVAALILAGARPALAQGSLANGSPHRAADVTPTSSAPTHQAGLRIVERASGVVYVDAGRDDGVVEGTDITFAHGAISVHAQVLAVSAHTAAVVLTPDMPELTTVPLPLAAVPEPPRVRTVHGPSPLPPFDPRWVDSYLPRVGEGRDQDSDDDDGVAHTVVRGELATRLFASAGLSDLAVAWDEVGIDSQLSVRTPSGLSWDHLIGLGLDAAPDVSFAIFQHARPRFDAYLLRLGYAPPGSRYGVGVGRILPLSGGGAGIVDGAELNIGVSEGVRLSAFAGLAPDAGDMLPALRAPRAGMALRVAGGEGVRGRLRVAFDVDGFRGNLDRVRGSVDAALDLGRQLSASGRMVVDFAHDALGRGGPRPTRGSAQVSGDHLRRRLRWHVGAGFDDPVYTRAIARQLPQEDLFFLPNAWADAGVSARLGHGVGARLRARGYLGADGFSSLLISAGGSLFGRVLEADLLDFDLRTIRGTLAHGYGGSVGWNMPFTARSRLELSYAFDRLVIGPAQRVGYAQTLHLGGDHRFTARTRASLAFEVGAGAGPLRALLFAQVAVRLGQVSSR